jgi:hypothetical protein
MLTAPPTLPFVGVSVMVLLVRFAVLKDDPGPPVMPVHVFVVVWLSVPAFNTEPWRAALIWFARVVVVVVVVVMGFLTFAWVCRHEIAVQLESGI